MDPASVDVRWLAQLGLTSLLLTVAGVAVLRHDAHTRRVFGTVAMVVLAAMPFVLMMSTAWSWPLLVEDPARWNRLWIRALPAALLVVGAMTGVLLAAGTVVGAVRARRELVACTPWRDARANGLATALAVRLGFTSAPVLRLSARHEPCCAPWGNDIVLPLRARHWPETTLRAVLAHELVHVDRRDGVQLLAFRLLLAAYWFLPWLRSLYRDYARAVEETCDDRAARLCESDVAYAESIAAVARELGAAELRARTAAALPAMGSHRLPARIRRFLDQRARELSVPTVYWTLIVVLGAGLIGANVEFEARPAPPLDVGRTAVALPPWTSTPAPRRAARLPLVEAVVEIRPPRAPVAALNRDAYREGLPRPIYPGRALLAGIEGEAVVRFDVTPHGRIVGAAIVASEPAVFGQAIMRALDTAGATPWRAAPGLDPGQYQIRYRFRIGGDAVADSPPQGE
jgi:TonB family protein